jgi:hypothetical protein
VSEYEGRIFEGRRLKHGGVRRRSGRIAEEDGGSRVCMKSVTGGEATSRVYFYSRISPPSFACRDSVRHRSADCLGSIMSRSRHTLCSLIQPTIKRPLNKRAILLQCHEGEVQTASRMHCGGAKEDSASSIESHSVAPL